ncbi:obscurin-like [Neocloeon triangulifer]|uniref:obscurin-like n=1 Tax=Neocloeon triangulifer TaxID=2078957 RepID=UPI00286F788A|nr:obscurin-like [Neocloeon triangulifer]
MAQTNDVVLAVFSKMSYDELVLCLPVLYAEAPDAQWRDIALEETLDRMIKAFSSGPGDYSSRQEGSALLELACLLARDPATKVALFTQWLQISPGYAPPEMCVAAQLFKDIVQRYGAFPTFEGCSEAGKALGLQFLDVVSGGEGWRTKPLDETVADLSKQYGPPTRRFVTYDDYKADVAAAERLIADEGGLSKFLCNTMLEKHTFRSTLSHRRFGFFCPRSDPTSPYVESDDIDETGQRCNSLNIPPQVKIELVKILTACNLSSLPGHGREFPQECVPSDSSDEDRDDESEKPSIKLQKGSRKRKATSEDEASGSKVRRKMPARKKPKVLPKPAKKDDWSSMSWSMFAYVPQVAARRAAPALDMPHQDSPAPSSHAPLPGPSSAHLSPAPSSPAALSVEDLAAADDQAAPSSSNAAASTGAAPGNFAASVSPQLVAAVAAAANAAAPFLQASAAHVPHVAPAPALAQAPVVAPAPGLHQAPAAQVLAPLFVAPAPAAQILVAPAPLAAPGPVKVGKARKQRQQAAPYTPRRSSRAAAQSATQKIHELFVKVAPAPMTAAIPAPPAIFFPAPHANVLQQPVAAPANVLPQHVAAPADVNPPPAPAPAANPLIPRRPRRDWSAPPVLGTRRSTRAAAKVAKAKIHHCLERNANLATFVYSN